MKKRECYRNIYNLLLTKEIPENILRGYLEEDEEDYLRLSDFIGMHLRPEIDWSTSIGIIEAVEKIHKEALLNGNLK